MDSSRRNFGPMSERTMENAQVHLLSSRYDLSKDSLKGRLIAEHVNGVLDEAEKRAGIRRVKPGELYLKTTRGELILPIRTAADINRAISGDKLEDIRRDIFKRCLKECRILFPSLPETLEGNLNQLLESSEEIVEADKILRALSATSTFFWHGIVKRNCNNGEKINSLQISQKRYGAVTAPVNEELMKGLLYEAENSQTASVFNEVESPSVGFPFPFAKIEGLHYSAETKREIMDFLGKEAGIVPAIREAMFRDLAVCRSFFCPLASELSSGQMPLVSMHVKSGRRLDLPTRLQPLAPVVVTLITPQELSYLGEKNSFEYDEYIKFNAHRMARVLVQAYRQDGLISYSELQWCFLTSSNSIGRILGWYQHEHNVLLPCPGTVLDMGRMLTHKEIIVRLHLKGMTVLEISRQTYHAPRSVDAYLKVFDSVLILHLYGLSKELMARVLSRGESLIEEYLKLVAENLKEVKEIRQYLYSRGVTLPEAC